MFSLLSKGLISTSFPAKQIHTNLIFSAIKFNTFPAFNTASFNQQRHFRKHTHVDTDLELGRSFNVRGGRRLPQAYSSLKKLLFECKVRDQVRLQSRFESNPARKKRKRRERIWNAYLEGMRNQLKKGVDLRNRYVTRKSCL